VSQQERAGDRAGGLGHRDRLLTPAEVERVCDAACAELDARGQRVLLLVPDLTRSCPLGLLFRLLHERLAGEAARIDVLVALGTHPPLGEAELLRLLGIDARLRASRYAEVGIFNHAWRDPDALAAVGRLAASEIKALTDGLFEQDVTVTVNRRVLDCDRLLIVGPVFPHEVVGFSGGNKYLAPGVAGAEIIDFFHWLGAVITSPAVIGHKWTPVRQVVDRAAGFVPTPRRALCAVVQSGGLAGLYHGSAEAAWSAAADLSSALHVVWHERPYHTVLACAPDMYNELWVGGKCMYKLEPVVADGGRLVIHAPHIRRLSATHGATLEAIGYHVRDYFLSQWDRFAHLPWGVLAHSTHVKGVGHYRSGVEEPRIEVVLATGIPEEVCRRINLGYLDPARVDPAAFQGREAEGVLCVERAGETLHRLA
jgi:nickel-dependent lactate racemase